MFEAVLLFVGMTAVTAALVASVRRVPKTDPFYV